MAIAKDFKAVLEVFVIVVLAIAIAQSFITKPLQLVLCRVI